MQDSLLLKTGLTLLGSLLAAFPPTLPIKFISLSDSLPKSHALSPTFGQAVPLALTGGGLSDTTKYGTGYWRAGA